MDHKLFTRRIYIPFFLAIIIVIVFAIKLFYLQIIHGSSYVELADRQYVSSSSQVFNRGTIYFKTKDGTEVSAGALKTGYKLAVNGKLIPPPRELYQLIGSFLGMDEKTFIGKVDHPNDSYIELASTLSADVATTLNAKKIAGVSLYKNNWRFYPAESLGSHVIGFMGYKGNDFAGRYGLERTYDSVLSRDDERLYVNFFAEVFSDITKFLDDASEEEGDIVTTIEPTVQKTLEDSLAAVIEKWGSDRAGGIIMDPNTGAIYAMALDNGFDLNNTRTVTDISQFNNPLVENVYEMGSIMKPIIMAIGLDQGVVTPETQYFDQGFVKVGDRTIYNFDKRGRGQSNMQTVLNQSLNTGMVFVMQRMNKTAFKKQWESFGFGEKTGIDLPAEGSGLISNLNTMRDVEFANVSFGQGVAVTPVQMIRALAALANGGKLVTPHLVQSIEYPSGFKKDLKWPIVTDPLLKPETLSTITKMLTTVFDNYDGGKIKFEHYTIAAKTGTAQVANPKGGYFGDRNLHTFMAYFPAERPRFIVFLYNLYPKNGARYSSETLIPPFLDIAKFLMSYYDLPPDR